MASRAQRQRDGSTDIPMAQQADRHILYQEAVQAPETEIDFFLEAFRGIRGREPLVMREDFCGTAHLAAEWCKGDPKREAIGVDISDEALDWGLKNNIEPAGDDVARRLTLIHADVRDVTEPKVDFTCALNFSYCLFEKRDELRDYFERAREGLKDDGLLILDLFGGTECYDTAEEERELEENDAVYVWEQATFNPITHHMQCRIHFKFPDGSRMDNAFTYAWRLWSIPEITDLLREAGYSDVHIYWERFEEDEDDDEYLEGTGEYYEATEVDNQESWVSYIVAER